MISGRSRNIPCNKDSQNVADPHIAKIELGCLGDFLPRNIFKVVTIDIFSGFVFSVMQNIDVLTISSKLENDYDLVKLIQDARDYFPKKTWDEIRYVEELSLERDVKIAVGGEPSEAFLFEKLVKRIGKVKGSEGLSSLLLGVTTDPIVALYHSFDGAKFRKTVYLVHDYVSEKIGVVSLFQVNRNSSSKVVAHGLGHNRGLSHHAEPIDLMYPGLLMLPTLQIEGFCEACLRRLTKH